MASPLERRAKKRFAIERPARYRRLYGVGRGEGSQGRVLEVSGRGVWLETQAPASLGEALEVTIDWPVSLDGGIPLQLVTAGPVVRVSGNHAAVAVERYEFRTARNK